MLTLKNFLLSSLLIASNVYSAYQTVTLTTTAISVPGLNDSKLFVLSEAKSIELKTHALNEIHITTTFNIPSPALILKYFENTGIDTDQIASFLKTHYKFFIEQDEHGFLMREIFPVAYGTDSLFYKYGLELEEFYQSRKVTILVPQTIKTVEFFAYMCKNIVFDQSCFEKTEDHAQEFVRKP